MLDVLLSLLFIFGWLDLGLQEFQNQINNESKFFFIIPLMRILFI